PKPHHQTGEREQRDQDRLEEQVDLAAIAREYPIAGGAINNISLHCSLRALVRGDNTIRRHDLIEAIRREFRKEGKTV
ncbi:MAG: ATP-binding protein, partial [Bacteroidetes bacterium]